MPSSLTWVISRTLGYSPHLPVAVCGTVGRITSIEAFLGSLIRVNLRAQSSIHHLSVLGTWICLRSPPTGLDLVNQHESDLSLLRHPIAQTLYSRYRNIDLFSIVYVFRPRLRVRLTLSGLTFLRKPWVYGEQVFHLFYRYSCRHNLFRYVHHSLQSSFIRIRNAPLPPLRARSFGAGLESRSLSAQNH